jgi:hypothetical protein
MSISKKSIIDEAESKGKYLNTDQLDQLSQIVGEDQKRFKIVNLINENSKYIIDQAINDYVQINRSIKQLDNDQTSILIQKLDIIFRFVTYAFYARYDGILGTPELQKTYLELKDRVDYAAEIINLIKLLTVDYIISFIIKNSIESDTTQYSSLIVELEDCFDKVILTLEEVENNLENQPNEENQKESAPVANVINIPEKHELNIWQRGNRIIVFSSGCSFFGGLVGQFPGALIGAIAGAIYGSILKLETDSPN